MAGRVVIIGGGVGGHLVAHGLQEVAEVVLVDPKAHLEVPMAAPRLLVAPEVAQDALIPFDAFLPGVRHIRGRARLIDAHGVEIEGHRRIDADVVVVATGSAYASTLVKPELGNAVDRRAQLDAARAQLASAHRVLVVGGGPVGVEIAAEIVESLPGVQVTLVHSGDRLLPGTDEAAGRVAARWLTRHGVEVVLGDRVITERHEGPGEAVTTGGRRIAYDMALWCLGGRPRTEALRPHLEHVLDARGAIEVEPTLQVAGEPTLFAVGDVTALPENKLGRYAARHAAVVVRNTAALLAGEAPPARYEPATDDPSMVVTLGRGAAVGHIAGLPQWLVSPVGRVVKGRDMLVGKYRRRVGATASRR